MDFFGDGVMHVKQFLDVWTLKLLSVPCDSLPAADGHVLREIDVALKLDWARVLCSHSPAKLVQGCQQVTCFASIFCFLSAKVGTTCFRRTLRIKLLYHKGNTITKQLTGWQIKFGTPGMLHKFSRVEVQHLFKGVAKSDRDLLAFLRGLFLALWFLLLKLFKFLKWLAWSKFFC